MSNPHSGTPRVTWAPSSIISGPTWPHPGLCQLWRPCPSAFLHPVSQTHRPQPRAQGPGPRGCLL